EAAVVVPIDRELIARVRDDVEAIAKTLAGAGEDGQQAVAVALKDLFLTGLRLILHAGRDEQLAIWIANDGVLEAEGNVEPAVGALANVRMNGGIAILVGDERQPIRQGNAHLQSVRLEVASAEGMFAGNPVIDEQQAGLGQGTGVLA